MQQLLDNDVDQPRAIGTSRTRGDHLFRGTASAAAASTFVIMALIATFLTLRGLPVLRSQGWSFFVEQRWQPDAAPAVMGIASLMYWTLAMALIALAIAVPVSILTALFITEYAPLRIKRPLTSLVDLLAAVPSLIFGLWGFFYLQPKMLGLSTWLTDHLAWFPLFRPLTDNYASSALIVGTVFAIMIVPIVTSVVREVFSQTPPVEKEGALALGATRWGMIRTVVLPFGRGGIIGGSMLGLGRALGETIAAAIIMSPFFGIRLSIVESGTNGIAPHIALRFGEAKELELSGLMAAGLALFGLTLVVNALATVVVSRSRSGAGVEI